MTEADKQQNALATLKSLNAAVTTTKLYPPSFPQVTNSVETAFEDVRTFLRNFEEFSFHLIDDEPILCGLPVNQKTLGKTHGQDIFQHLRLLKIIHVVLQRGLSRKIFEQLLVFFTSSPQLIKKEGGGRSFVLTLGLQELFPEQYTVETPTIREDCFALKYQLCKSEKAVSDQLINSLSSEIDAETVAGQKLISNFIAELEDPEQGVNLIVASISSVLKGLYTSGSIFFPLQFELILRNLNKIKDMGKKQQLALATAEALVQDLDAFALQVLFLQKYPKGFGAELYGHLLGRISRTFDPIVGLIDKELELVGARAGKDSGQYRQIVKARERLLATEMGKLYLVREKARGLLQVGEHERKAKRVQLGITAILQGDVNSLRNKEIIKHLPSTIESLISKGKDKLAAKIIENVTTELIKGEAGTHDLLSESLSLIGDSLILTEKWNWLEKLTIPLMAWVKKATKADQIFEKNINILQKILTYFWENNKPEKADSILQLYFAIRIGKLKKSEEIVEIVSRVQDLYVDKAQLPQLLAESLDEEDDDLTDRRLILQGPIATRFLLNSLFSSENAEHRIKIMELLSRMNIFLPPLLLEKLKEPMPWHDKRNLIKLLSDTGNSTFATEIFEYLNHDDIRVQKEAFACIYKLSGKDRKNNLLKALYLATGTMREQIVRALTPLADDEVVDEVVKLLEDWEHFSDDIRDSLLKRICALFGECKHIKGKKALERFLLNEKKAKARDIDPSVWQIAKAAHRIVKTYDREMSKKLVQKALTKGGAGDTDKVKDGEKRKRARSSFDEEQHIEQLLAGGDIDRAKKSLIDLISQASEFKKFNEAEELRKWLIKIDPMALTDILKAAETIEEQKKKSLNQDYLQIWSELYKNLTTEEFNALYYSMEHNTYKEEDVLAQQGKILPSLFFINHGEVRLYYNNKGSEVLLKVAKKGDVLGGDTFFESSVWTLNAAVLSTADISILHLDNTKKWQTDTPDLEGKLFDFCKKTNDLEKHLSGSDKNRREYARFPMDGQVFASILESDGTQTGIRMKGELTDISCAGVSFTLKISQKKNARVLLGRNVRVSQFSATSQDGGFCYDGVLVKVRSLFSVDNEYSAHVKFIDLVPEDELQELVDTGKVMS